MSNLELFNHIITNTKSKYVCNFKYENDIIYKKCRKCLEFKELSLFTKCKITTSKTTPSCSSCRNQKFQCPVKRREIYQRNKKQKSEYYQRNKKHIHEKRKEHQRKNLIHLMIKRARNTCRKALKRKCWKKETSFTKLIGCDGKTFINHLTVEFFKTYGIALQEKHYKCTHLDHIYPISKAKTIDDIVKLSHYTNLRLLHKDHNMEKHNSISYVIPSFPIDDA